MNEPEEPFNIDEIKKNALAQGVPLKEIAILYEKLTDLEKAEMRELGLIAYETVDGVIARFAENGDVFCKEKACGVLHLGA